MRHQPTLIPELRSLPPKDGWACYEQTGRAAAVCQCGLNTGFINTRDACQRAAGHHCPLQG